jgi:hypothetical protein
MAKSRDVIVLGWWASVQNRIDYAALLRRELRVGLAEAKAKLESSLETPVVLSIAPAERDRQLSGTGGEPPAVHESSPTWPESRWRSVSGSPSAATLRALIPT